MSEGLIYRVYKYRAYPTKAQVDVLERHLGFCCDLYNAALEQRRMLYRDHGLSITYNQQSRQLTDFRRDCPDLWPKGLSRSAMQKTLQRLDRSFRTFYRRVQRGERAGFPRFRSRHRWDSLQAQYGFGCQLLVDNGRRARLVWAGAGELKLRLHRPLPGGARVTEVQVKRIADGNEWYACFGCELPAPAPLLPTGDSVGVDLGITTFSALSTGERIPGPRSYRHHEARLARLQRDLARCQRGSNRYRRRRSALSRAHTRIGRVRRDHAHKTARSLVERFDVIVIENLNIRGLARSYLAKDVGDQAWGLFVAILAGKAEEAGRLLVKVDPTGSSQECSGCGANVPKRLSERLHSCACGLRLDRDVNAARVILGRGERLRENVDGSEKPAPVDAEREIAPTPRSA